ncbi:heavy metal-associated domain-containing protein [Catellatospora sp. NPDC049111]|uniref:heavy-metal-associated domain-containing protein n=1 Tax=Catellatospora sp. NPDC049111 TaxID=3155271 RepID=UPI0033D6741C
MITHVFDVEGMHCASCGLLIDETLEDEVAGVQRAETSVRKGRTVVTAEDEVDPAVIADAITAAGYPAVLTTGN